MDDFYLVREDIVLGSFPTHLGRTRLGGTRFTGHPAFISQARRKMYDCNTQEKRTNGWGRGQEVQVGEREQIVFKELRSGVYHVREFT